MTFVAWGLYYGFLLIIENAMMKTRLGRLWQLTPELIRVIWTFFLVLIGWALFRSPNLAVAKIVLSKMLIPSNGFMTDWQWILVPLTLLGLAAVVHMIFNYLEYDVDSKSLLLKTPWIVRSLIIGLTVTAVIILAGQQEAFIYFAF